MTTGVHTSIRDLTRLRYDAAGMGLSSDRAVGSIWTGRRRSRLRGRGLDFDELRHYRPGDDIRHMDWRVTRRTGMPFVRIFTEERDRPVWLIVDQRHSMFFGSRTLMKSVAAAEAAALLGWATIGAGDRAGGIVFSDTTQHHSDPGRHPEKLTRWLAGLTRINQSLNATTAPRVPSTHLSDVLAKLASRVGHDGLVILISDFHDWDSNCLRHLKTIRQHTDVMTILVSDPMERDLGSASRAILGDGGRQLSLVQLSREARQRFRQDFDTHRATLAETLGRYGIPLLDLDCSQATVAQLRRQLGQPARGR